MSRRQIMELISILLLGIAEVARSEEAFNLDSPRQHTESSVLSGDGSGSDPMYEGLYPASIVHDETQCGSERAGIGCKYTLHPYTSAVPMTQWGISSSSTSNTCVVFGKGTILTLDGASSIFQGQCEVLAVGQCNDMDNFSAWITRSNISEISHVRIRQGATDIIVSDVVTFNGKVVSVPYFESDFEIATDTNMFSVTYDSEFRVDIDVRRHVVAISVPETFSSCGLCGNQNGKADDDVGENHSPSDIERYSLECIDESVVNPTSSIKTCLILDSTHRVCNVLISDAFRDCVTYVNPTSFYKHCLLVVCTEDIQTRDDILCDLLTEYSRQCSFNYGSPGDWRSLTNCVERCRLGMQWSECVDSSRTCAAHSSRETVNICGSHRCLPGCECVKGTYLQDGVCVKSRHCQCEANGLYFDPGEQIFEECNNTCACEAGHWKCTEKACLGVAEATGNFHYVSFDGTVYQYQDTCSHVLTHDRNGDFQVLIAFEEHGGVFYKYPIIQVKEGNAYVEYTLKRNGHIMKSGKRLSLPITSGLPDIQKIGGSILFTIPGKVVQILYDMVASIVVKVSREYAGRLMGLAGNFNGKKSDDFQLQSSFEAKSVYTFAANWRADRTCVGYVPAVYSRSECDPAATAICNEIESFTNCPRYLEQATNCREDVCQFSTSKERKAHACSMKAGFFAACSARTTSEFDVISTAVGECGIHCEEPSVYRVSSECVSSCSSFSNLCKDSTHKGCFCPAGHYENDQGDCVRRDQCPCLFEGTWYQIGTTWIDDMECECERGVMECISKNATTTCSHQNEKYYSCDDANSLGGAACEASCEYPEEICSSDTCVPGCACKPGFYRANDGSCVIKEECGCFNGEKYIKHGDWIMDDCNKITCYGGVFKSTNLVCPSTCSAVGASHYKSFDGLRYDFEGDCEYILATDYCANNQHQGLFSVVTSNRRCGSTGMTCSKSIIISVKNQRIILQQDKEAIIEKIGGAKASQIHRESGGAITGYTDHSAADTFVMKQKGLFTVIETCIGLTVLWDNGTRVYIRLTEEFQGKTCGLCGNFDGVDGNDFTESTGLKTEDVVQFGNSWKLIGQNKMCPDTTWLIQANATCNDQSRKDWASRKCHTITDARGPFAECHSVVDPREYFDICVYDTCGCDSGGDCECLCTAIAHYAHICANKGVAINWRTNNLCPIMCEQYNDDEDICLWHYRPCATCITDTCCECLQPRDAQWCVEGCFPKCPSGYILDEMTQKCIAASERNTQCTWFSSQNICHTCKKCDICKTEFGGSMQIQPGQTAYFPYETDSCLVEWCAAATTGDLCYNGTVEIYNCEEYPIPHYDDRYYSLICWNSTTAECKNCRECEPTCKERNDSCEPGKTPEDAPWRKVIPILPVPELGPKTYCVDYTCENHPVATDPQCPRQRESRVLCAQSIDEIFCAEHEVLQARPTGDECCPEKYHCVCEVCTLTENGVGTFMKHILPGERNEWCESEENSNCCYIDICADATNTFNDSKCPVVTRIQANCNNTSVPTCQPGYVWVNKTRAGDCCPWGECECDCCYDYNELNERSEKPVGDQWTKKCLKFTCQANARDSTGCFVPQNHENVTCPPKPECGYNERLSSVLMNEDDCCETYECVCHSECRVTIDGKVKVFEIDDEFIGPSGCWQRCVNGSEITDCPVPTDICQEPSSCGECQIISQVVADSCGCDQNRCEYIEKCPPISCSRPFIKKVNESADACKSPCYYCDCDECLDDYQNTTYAIGTSYTRVEKLPAMCYNCTCTSEIDVDKCPKEVCIAQRCKDVQKCLNDYETPVIEQNECGCDVLVRCECNHCMFDGKILEGKEPGQTWTSGNISLGCYDTYHCSSYNAPLQCFNVTKDRFSCETIAECKTGFKLVNDESRSCFYDDGEYCERKSCVCENCRFEGVFYAPGTNWTKDCIDYTCTNDPDPHDPDGCFYVQSNVQPCPSPDLNCVNCRVQYLRQKRQVPEHCCNVWDCKPELFCEKDDRERVPNGTIWEPKACHKVQCVVTKEDWAEEICPDIIPVEYCEEDKTVCGSCQTTNIIRNDCDCPVVQCDDNPQPISCLNPGPNQIVESFGTGDSCLPSKSCCVCDTACYNGDTRHELFSVWHDEDTCQRMRCVLPDKALNALGYNSKDVDYYNTENSFSTISSLLNYRNLLNSTGIPQSLYSNCTQDHLLCPSIFNIGCAKPIECAQCEKTIESMDKCGCPILTCEPLDFPNHCMEPGSNQRLATLETNDICFPSKNCCVCETSCIHKGIRRQLFEVWQDEETCTQMRCVLPEPTLRKLGYEGRISYNELENNTDMELVFNNFKSSVDFRAMIVETAKPWELASPCQQDISLCPTIMEIGCRPIAQCPPCHTRVISQDSCGCDIADCVKVNKCDAELKCPYSHQRHEVLDADPCQAPCFECVCDWCYDNFDNATFPVGKSWNRFHSDPVTSCEVCTCTNGTDEKDLCMKEECVPFSCDAPKECAESYNQPIYRHDMCGCQVLVSCECTQCMLDGDVLLNRTAGDWWTEGDVMRGCYLSYYCNPTKNFAMEQECYDVTVTPSICHESPSCPENFIPIKDEERSCCMGDRCCPQYTCECVVCMMDGVVYMPGEEWTKNCIDYVCTNETDMADPKQCKKIIDTPTPCNDTEVECKDCYVEYLAVRKNVTSEQCCNVYSCKADLVCVASDGVRTPNGTTWTEPCQRFECFVSDQDFADGMCPQPVERNHCFNNLNESCSTCTNKKIVPDECGCDSVACEPLDEPVQCAAAEPYQVVTSLETGSNCFPSKNCCVCDRACYHNGIKKKLFSVWIDEITCQRVMCTPPNSVLNQLGYDASNLDFNQENVTLQDGILYDIDYRKMMQDSKVASQLYDQCSQDSALCPIARQVGCPVPDPCPECMRQVTTDVLCGCPKVTCEPITCTITNSSDCTLPKIVFKKDSVVSGDECCPGYCECPQDCTDKETGRTYDRNFVWNHPDTHCFNRTCLVDPGVNKGCPYIANKTVCLEPEVCDDCSTGVESRDDCDCLQRTCKRNHCPTKTCDNDCDEAYQTGEDDDCGCPLYECRPKPCPIKGANCDDAEKSVYSWMDLSIDKCCLQHACRCNFTKCARPECPPGEISVRNISAVKCCCPEYACIPDDASLQCVDYNGVPRKLGVSWVNKDNQCKKLQCMYANAKKSAYRIEEYDRYHCSDVKLPCTNGREPYLTTTKDGCCQEWVCPCTCEAYGDPHFTTFDGFSYDYQGKCTYTLMKEYRFNQTEIVIDNELCRWHSDRVKSLSCVKTLNVIHKKVNYTFTFGLKFLKDGEEISARNPWISQDGDVTIKEFGYKQLKLQIHPIKLEILYKTREWMQSLIVSLPYETLEGKMSGLCGSCNNNIDDDMQDQSLSTIAIPGASDQESTDHFGESWMKSVADYDEPSCFPKEPDCPTPAVYPDCGNLPVDECIDCSNRCHLSHDKCNECDSNPCEVLTTHPVFKKANAHIDPIIYKLKCAYDVSLDSNITRKCDPCNSASIAQYVALNELRGVCVPWRSALNCSDVSCPHPSQEFRECDLDVKQDLSCDSPILNVTGSVKVEGCFCPEGTVRRRADSEECVPVKCCHGCSEPPTCQDGSVSLISEKKDDCGCPSYWCSDIQGCVIQETEQFIQMNITGKTCSSPDRLKTASCGGNCGVTTTSRNGAIEAGCSRCNPTKTETRTVNLACEDGSTQEYEYENIVECSCADCSTCSDNRFEEMTVRNLP